MTNEEVKEVLSCRTNLGYGIVIENESPQVIEEALETVIKTSEQPTMDKAMIHTLAKENDELKAEIGRLRQVLEQQSSDDCISRKDLLTKTWDADTKCGYVQVVDRADIENAAPVTPIFSQGMTNGDVIKAMFPNCKIMLDNEGFIGVRPVGENWIIWFTQSWWNALYEEKRGNENDSN